MGWNRLNVVTTSRNVAEGSRGVNLLIWETKATAFKFSFEILHLEITSYLAANILAQQYTIKYFPLHDTWKNLTFIPVLSGQRCTQWTASV